MKQFNDEILNRQEEITETIWAEQNHRNSSLVPASLLHVNGVLRGWLENHPKLRKISGSLGENKRNQTADPLNAMSAIREQNEFRCIL